MNKEKDNTPRMIAVHLLNDRSGSPLVFKQALESLAKNHEIILYTATPYGEGFLSHMAGINVKPLFYRRGSNRLTTLFFFILSQVLLFATLCVRLRKSDTVYVNTLLPFGAALAGYIRSCSVVYHIHEVSVSPAILKNFLYRVADLTACKVIYVSKYLSEQYTFRKAKQLVIYNCLPESFSQKAAAIPSLNLGHLFTVSMLCSLKAYKGIYHFVNIARRLPMLQFQLVLNAPDSDVENFKTAVNAPDNCTILPTQHDTIAVYGISHVIMNLSKPDGWVETFGMTILEAMACGRPVVTPTIGGVRELINNGIEGFCVDSNDEDAIVRILETMSGDMSLYMRLSNAALARANKFDRNTFDRKIHRALGVSNAPFIPKNKNVFREMEIQ